jgi:hypothetical protein
VPKQNRVTPFGALIAVPERGAMMGNRGVLHEDGGIKRPWQVRRWLVCVLDFRGRQRTVMSPGRYTELFFLDEATALAAGHRPCAECRHARFLAFCDAWKKASPALGSSRATAKEIDDRLHAERIAPDGSKRTYLGALDELPDGVVVTVGAERRGYLVVGAQLLAWSPGGYGERRRRPKGEEVEVLTPKTTVATIRAGYVPEIHPSGGGVA